MPSRILPSGETSTTPAPAGPGLPEQAPSVYAIHAPAGMACGGDLAPRALASGGASAGPQNSSGCTAAAWSTTRLRTAARYAFPSFGL